MPLPWLLSLPLLLAWPPLGQDEAAPAGRLTTRDLGFVELSPSPYSLAPGQGPGWLLLAQGRAPLPLVAPDRAAALELVQGSPALERLSREALASLALAVVFEGRDPRSGAELEALLEGAEQALLGAGGARPRDLAWTLRRVVVPFLERHRERVLLWCLGLEGLGPEPAVALVFGRGQLAGPALRGPLLTEDELLARLLPLVRPHRPSHPLDPTRLPVAWGPAQGALSLSSLGFDPAEPAVVRRAQVLAGLEEGRQEGDLEQGQGSRPWWLAGSALVLVLTLAGVLAAARRRPWIRTRGAVHCPPVPTSKTPPVIAIDGPAASGKSSVARRLAERLGVPFLNTGAMYRAVGQACAEAQVELDDEAACARVARQQTFELDASGHLLWNGEPAEPRVDGELAGAQASRVALLPAVREVLVAQQRELGRRHGCVAEGRDTTTVVFPEADHKFFLWASPAERGRRRATQDGAPERADQVAGELEARDAQDAGRAVAPLVQAEDARRVDTDGLDLEQVVELLAAQVEGDRS